MRDDLVLAETPDSLTDAVLGVRANSLLIAEPLSLEDKVVQSAMYVSPTKWHLAHTTWFWETFVLSRLEPDAPPFDETFNYLFNSYYNAIGERHERARRGVLTRPSLEQVLAYRQHVDEALERALDSADDALRPILELGVAHEEQHQELMLTDIKHVLAENPFWPQAYPPKKADDASTSSAPALAWVDFIAGLHEFGASASTGFMFDNETPRHRHYLHDFRLASRCVTNGEVADFIEDGGYATAALWLSDGWDMVADRKQSAPMYWRGAPGEWSEFTLHGEQPLNPHAPACHLTFYEADAIARWFDARLPDEREWELATQGVDPASGQFSEPGASAHPAFDHRTDHALLGQFGGVWEWTRSAYSPYPGYQASPGALGEYNGKFMANQFVLRGGSCATPRGHVRATYRNFFYPDMYWQFSGLRLARDR